MMDNLPPFRGKFFICRDNVVYFPNSHQKITADLFEAHCFVPRPCLTNQI